jgi:hypothetical protein
VKIVAAALGPERGNVLNLKISRFFEIMVVCDKVWTLLASNRWSDKGERKEKENCGKEPDAARVQTFLLPVESELQLDIRLT